MNQAFVEHAEHDINRDQRRRQQDRDGGERRLKHLGSALKTALHARGHLQFFGGSPHNLGGLPQRYFRREVKGEGDRRELSLVVDGEKRVARLKFRDTRQRHLGAVRGRDIELLERSRIQLKL